MRKTIYILITALVLALASCTDEERVPNPSVGALVVEGWIEDGGKPVVIVTRAADLSAPTGPIDDLVQRWCRVTVSDGETTERLAMHIDNNYMPPVIYTSAHMRGRVGNTYTLTVETDIDMVKAVTTIPPVSRIDSLVAYPKVDDPDTYMLKVFTPVDAGKSRYYKIFTRVNSETRYYSSFLGLFKAEEYDPAEGWTASRGIHQTFDGRYTPNYQPGDTVDVKLCTLDRIAYDFWQSYETAVSLQSNFFFSSTEECRGNIEGGKGYWAGYGSSFRRIIIK